MKKNVLLLLIIVFVAIASCKKDVAKQPPSNEEMATIAGNKAATKIPVCHNDAVTGKSKLLELAEAAWPEHEAHGDVRLDDQDGDGDHHHEQRPAQSP